MRGDSAIPEAETNPMAEGAPFSVLSGRSGVATGRIPYAILPLHRFEDVTKSGLLNSVRVTRAQPYWGEDMSLVETPMR